MIPRRLVILGVHRVIEIRYRRPRLSVVRHRRRLRRLCVSKQGNGQMHPACESREIKTHARWAEWVGVVYFSESSRPMAMSTRICSPETGWGRSMKQISLHHGFPPKTLPPEFQARGKKCANPILL